MLTLAISCLTTSNLPWFMDLTFQVPVQYCSLQRQTSLSPPDTSTCFWVRGAFILALYSFRGIFLCPSLVAYWAPTDPGSSIFSVIFFCFFILLHGVPKARMLKWFAIPFSSGLFLSELSTMTYPSSPGHLLHPGIKPVSSPSVGRFFTTEPQGYSLFPYGQVLICIPYFFWNLWFSLHLNICFHKGLIESILNLFIF